MRNQNHVLSHQLLATGFAHHDSMMMAVAVAPLSPAPAMIPIAPADHGRGEAQLRIQSRPRRMPATRPRSLQAPAL